MPLNLWSNVTDYVCAPATAPDWANLGLCYAYGVTLINTTATDIDSGDVIFETADADPANVCEPGPFSPLEPVADCNPIVTGIPYTDNVHYTISPERPLPAHGMCNIAAPCPQQFIRVSGLPAGVLAFVVMTRLRRWDNTPAEWGYIPRPLAQPFQTVMAQPGALPPPATAPMAAARGPATPAAPATGRGRAGARASTPPPRAPEAPAE